MAVSFDVDKMKVATFSLSDEHEKTFGYFLKMAVLELNLLNEEGLLPSVLEGSSASGRKHPWTSGGSREPLSWSVELLRNGVTVGFFEFGVSQNAGAILRYVELGPDVRFHSSLPSLFGNRVPILVAYDHPRIAFVGIDEAGTPLLFDATTLSYVAPAAPVLDPTPCVPAGFNAPVLPEDILRGRELKRRRLRFQAATEFWGSIINQAKNVKYEEISREWFASFKAQVGWSKKTRCVQAGDTSDRLAQREFQPQCQENWCVPACLTHVFSFYRYGYDQRFLAASLGFRIGELTNRVERTEEHQIVEVIEDLSRNAIDFRMLREPEWEDAFERCKKGYPFILINPGHCRVVVGAAAIDVAHKDSTTGLCLRGICLLNPYPAHQGSRICWEDFDSFVYYALFFGEVELLTEEEAGVRSALVSTGERWLQETGREKGLPRHADVIGVERVDKSDDKSLAWIVTIGEGRHPLGFIGLDENLDVLQFKESAESEEVGGCHDWIDRRTARRIAEAKVGEHSRVSPPELVLERNHGMKLEWQTIVGKGATRRRITIEKWLLEE